MTNRRTGERDFQIQRGETASEAVLRAVQTVSEEQIIELPPLQDSVDVEALDQLIDSSNVLSIEFGYHGLNVTVEQDRIALEEQ